MRILVASDIHGSAFYCEKLLHAFEKEQAQRLLLLGDILYHGPRNALTKEYATKETAALLNSYKDKIFCVRGNCDAEVDQMMLDFPIMAPYCVLAVDAGQGQAQARTQGASQTQGVSQAQGQDTSRSQSQGSAKSQAQGQRLIYATHGHMFNTNNLPPLCAGDILLHGHTHVPAWEEFGESNLYLNPGSVSIPKQNSQHGYILLANNQAQFKTLDGDIYHVQNL